MRASLVNTFTATLHADARVAGSAEDVFAVISDPTFVARSTPFIRRVVDLGDGCWRWEVAGIRYPGGTFTAAFTEEMGFEGPHLVTFAHAPRGAEPAGADGAFRLAPDGDGDGHVRLDLEVHVRARVPAPRAAAPLVEAAMDAVMAVMRDRFVRTLEHTLRTARR